MKELRIGDHLNSIAAYVTANSCSVSIKKSDVRAKWPTCHEHNISSTGHSSRLHIQWERVQIRATTFFLTSPQRQATMNADHSNGSISGIPIHSSRKKLKMAITLKFSRATKLWTTSTTSNHRVDLFFITQITKIFPENFANFFPSLTYPWWVLCAACFELWNGFGRYSWSNKVKNFCKQITPDGGTDDADGASPTETKQKKPSRATKFGTSIYSKIFRQSNAITGHEIPNSNLIEYDR